MQFNEFLASLDAFLWGGPLALLILSLGIYLTVRLKFIQVRLFGRAFSLLSQNSEKGEGEISPFGALCTSLSATVGTGNIIGVATALSVGGPGALFWMVVTAFFGMAIKYSEGFLAVKYRITEGGKTKGGPFYYIENGMGKSFKFLSLFFAFSGLLASLLGMGTLTQSNSIAETLTGLFSESDNKAFLCFGENAVSSVRVITAFLVTILSGAVICGGIKRISRIAEIIVPLMAITYAFCCLVIIIGNGDKLIPGIYTVIKSAFLPEAVFGAASGITLKEAIKWGVSGGVFSNEAGLGTSPIADSEARTDSPENQGLIAMTGTFIDTFLICNLTGLSVIVTGNFAGNTSSGAEIAQKTFSSGLPFGEEVSLVLLSVCLCFFAFSTIIGYCHYGEACLSYITGGKRGIKLYRFLYIAAVFAGAFLSVPTVWTMARIFNALMALPNLIALFCMGKKIK